NRLIVVDDELELATQQTALGVEILLAQLIAFVLVLAQLRVGAGERERRADPDRTLGSGRHHTADGEGNRDRERGRCFRGHGEPPAQRKYARLNIIRSFEVSRREPPWRA